MIGKEKAEWSGKGSKREGIEFIPCTAARLGLGLTTRVVEVADFFAPLPPALVAGALRFLDPAVERASSSSESSSSESSSSMAAALRPFVLALVVVFLTGTAAAAFLALAGVMEGRDERRGVPATEGAPAADAMEAERAPASG